MLREFEKLCRRGLSLFKPTGKELPLRQRSSLLKRFHGADCIVADLGTSLNMGGSNLNELVGEMDRLMSDPEVQEVHRKLFEEKVEKLGRGINGYESFSLWSKAGRIVEERKKED